LIDVDYYYKFTKRGFVKILYKGAAKKCSEKDLVIKSWFYALSFVKNLN
jgi:hypothetical protein